MTSTFADSQGHALGVQAPSTRNAHRSQQAVLTAALFAGLLAVGAVVVAVVPMIDLTNSGSATTATVALSDYRLGEIGAGQVSSTSSQALREYRLGEIGAGQVATSTSQALREYRLGEIGAGQVATSTSQALRQFRAEEIALGSVPAPDPAIPFAKAHAAPVDFVAATTPIADQGYRDQRAGEIGGSSGGASGTSERTSGK